MTGRAALVAALLACTGTNALAQTDSTRLKVHGFVDGMYGYNFNQPSDHASFLPGLGTSAKRDNEFTINLAQADLTLPPKPVGFKLALGFGTATEVVHAAEVSGVATSPEVWRHVVQASAQYQTEVGNGLLVEAGVYPSHIGMEGFATRDNWNYTRSWLGELSPYYQAGMKFAYPFSSRWSAQLHLINGWQVIGDNNRGKSVGAQVAYGGEQLTVALNGIAGPERTNDDVDQRVLGDVVAIWKVTPSLGLGATADLAREQRSAGGDAHWGGGGLYGRIAPPGSRTAFAVRGEYYDDRDGAISGTQQILRELTATLEHRPVPALILKLESRYDRSSARVFGTGDLDAGGSPLFERDQLLLVFGAVAGF